MESDRLLLFSGAANEELVNEIAATLGTSLASAIVTRWQDGETRVQINANVRGADVFVIQPTCPHVDENLMRLLVMMDALRRASPRRITAVIPYYGYAKQEKKSAGREPITAKLVANLITVAGADRILTMDLHSAAIEGFFDIPVDHLRAGPLLAEKVLNLKLNNIVVVSPDSGGVHRAYEFRSYIGNARLALMAKYRPQPETAEVVEMVGEVSGRTAIIVDDMIQSGGTVIECADKLREKRAGDIYVCATHAVFAAGAIEKLKESPIKKVIVTNTIPVDTGCCGKERFEVVTVAPLLAEAIQRIHKDQSLSVLFPQTPHAA
jgi:ribose-phosphate pyrophosphokinase